MDFKYVLYSADGPVATITLNRPEYRNAQSYPLLQDVDDAFTLAEQDDAVRVVVVRGAGGNFSAGHDLGTPDNAAAREARATMPGIQRYNEFKKYNLDLLLRWRNFPKPTIAMVEGYCIYAGWMLAGCLDLVFAARDAQFLAGVIEYMSVPWDIGVKRAKEIVYESRFMSASEAAEWGFVNRVLDPADLERETYAYAHRVAEANPVFVRIAKVMMNKAQDMQGYTSHLEDALGDYLAMGSLGGSPMAEGVRRLASVDLAVRHRRGDRYGLTPPDAEAAGSA
jgi:enoyl-CoA hydratase